MIKHMALFVPSLFSLSYLCVSLYTAAAACVYASVVSESPSPWERGREREREWSVRAAAEGKKAERRDKAEGTRGNKNDVIIQM